MIDYGDMSERHKAELMTKNEYVSYSLMYKPKANCHKYSWQYNPLPEIPEWDRAKCIELLNECREKHPDTMFFLEQTTKSYEVLDD